MKKLLLFLMLISLMGCTASRARIAEPTYTEAQTSSFVRANYQATDKLLASLTQDLFPGVPLVVATLVNIDELTESSRLGRTISEQIGARLITQGYPVVELKMRDNIFVKRSEGELLLSRELQDVVRSHQAQAVVVGTYSTAKSIVYLNIKIVSMNRNIIIAAHDYALPLDNNVRALLMASAHR